MIRSSDYIILYITYVLTFFRPTEFERTAANVNVLLT